MFAPPLYAGLFCYSPWISLSTSDTLFGSYLKTRPLLLKRVVIRCRAVELGIFCSTTAMSLNTVLTSTRSNLYASLLTSIYNMNMRTSISTTASAQWQCTGADTLHSPGDARHSCATTFDNFWHTERCLDAHKTPHSTHVRIYTAIVFYVIFGVQELIHYVIKFNTSSKRSEGTSHA